MDALALAQRYFDAWSARDRAAVLKTFVPGGTYTDPTTQGPLSGPHFSGYLAALFAAFPDLTFEVESAGLVAPDLVAAQWVMRGTNRGPFNGLPPTDKTMEVRGADFIRVVEGGIYSVEGYFDSRVVALQLGLETPRG
jgi:steroid delta-isomerase-like uncharacterized protein